MLALSLVGCIIVYIINRPAEAQDCNVYARCGSVVNSIPRCTEETDDAQKCLTRLLTDCHRSKEAENLFEQAKLRKTVFCQDSAFYHYFVKNADCWRNMDTCLNPIIAAKNQLYDDKLNQDSICRTLSGSLDRCTKNPNETADCNEMRLKFINAGAESIGCRKDAKPILTTTTTTPVRTMTPAAKKGNSGTTILPIGLMVMISKLVLINFLK